MKVILCFQWFFFQTMRQLFRYSLFIIFCSIMTFAISSTNLPAVLILVSIYSSAYYYFFFVTVCWHKMPNITQNSTRKLQVFYFCRKYNIIIFFRILAFQMWVKNNAGRKWEIYIDFHQSYEYLFISLTNVISWLNQDLELANIPSLGKETWLNMHLTLKS